MKTNLTSLVLAVAVGAATPLHAASNQLLGWNNLGMHCMDSDYSVFSILPPYNTIEAQLIVAGKLVTNGVGYSVTYQAVADPDGSFNSTAMGKGNYYEFATALYGAVLAPEGGLAGWPMPGTNNNPPGMLFEATNRPAPEVATPVNWFRAEGIPIAPYDDAGRKNPYPMMRLIARNGGGAIIASNDIVLPVSDEMDCRACHASGTQAAAKPKAGWVWSGNSERDFRLNILRLHDEHQFANHAGLYAAALNARGFNSQGLYRGVVADGKPVLCAVCHASEALGTGSYSNIPPLTASVHAKHATVTDPDLNITLDSSAHRAACYRCHPGSATKCLRGAMGGAIAPDGAMSMQCQSCHGSMSQVGSLNRVGWFMEPNCQSCHSGTATSNNGQIRYTSVFETNGNVRVATNQTFATQPNTPAPGISLYRFSAGHGGLQCSACHGSTHAEFPATHRNDNIRNEKIQGHAGVMIECTACHVSMSPTTNNVRMGPHGMHPIGQSWVDNHPDLSRRGGNTVSQCRDCHGIDYRGTVLSRMQTTRTFSTKFGSKTFWRGRAVSCYDCHNGSGSSNTSTHPPAIADSVLTNTTSGATLNITLTAAGAGTLSFRTVSQPAHGSVGISNNVATYFPDAGFIGTDQFTFTVNNGWVDGNLATGTITVAEGPYSLEVQALVPPLAPAGWNVPFSAVPALSNSVGIVSYEWNFGDGSLPGTNRNANHAYATAGTFAWSLTARAGTAAATVGSTINIDAPARLGIAPTPGGVIASWPRPHGNVVAEWTDSLQSPVIWRPDTNAVFTTPDSFRTTMPGEHPVRFLRLRQVQ